MAPEKSHDREPHHEVSRRGFLTTSLQLTVGFSIVGCLGSDISTPSSPVAPASRIRTSPRAPDPNHFDNRKPGSSILQTSFTLGHKEAQQSETFTVLLESPFVWTIDAFTYDIRSLEMNGHTAKPSTTIPCTSMTVEECIQRITVADDNTGIDIHTSIGLIHVPIKNFTELVRTIRTPSKEYDGTQTLSVHADVYPNDIGNTALHTVNGWHAVKRFAGGDAPHVTIPDSVRLTLSERGFDPKSTETPVTDAPETATEQELANAPAKPLFTEKQLETARKWFLKNVKRSE